MRSGSVPPKQSKSAAEVGTKDTAETQLPALSLSERIRKGSIGDLFAPNSMSEFKKDLDKRNKKKKKKNKHGSQEDEQDTNLELKDKLKLQEEDDGLKALEDKLGAESDEEVPKSAPTTYSNQGSISKKSQLTVDSKNSGNNRSVDFLDLEPKPVSDKQTKPNEDEKGYDNVLLTPKGILKHTTSTIGAFHDKDDPELQKLEAALSNFDEDDELVVHVSERRLYSKANLNDNIDKSSKNSNSRSVSNPSQDDFDEEKAKERDRMLRQKRELQKQENDAVKKKKKRDPYNRPGLKFLKICFVTLMGLLVLGGMVGSKVTMVMLARYHSDENFFGDNKPLEGTSKISGVEMTAETFANLFLVIAFPLTFFTFICAMMYWIREYYYRPRWKVESKVKRRKMLLLAIIEALYESVGICAFVLLSLPQLTAVQGILSMHTLAGLSIIFVLPSQVAPLCACMGKSDTSIDVEEDTASGIRKSITFFIRILLIMAQVLGIAILVLHTGVWELAIAVVCLGASWWRNFVPYSLISEPWRLAFYQKRYGFSATKNVIKLGLVILFSFLIGRYGYGIEAREWFTAIGEATYANWTLETSALYHIQVACSFVAYYAAWISLSACLQLMCLTIPAILSTPIALSILMGNYDALRDDTSLFAGALLWVSSTIFIFSYLRFLMNRMDHGQLEQDLFAEPGFLSPFIEQSLTLNRKRKPKIRTFKPDAKEQNDRRKHITFVMCTLYREGLQEMRNLVNSLYCLDHDTTEKLEHYEAHVTFDNAFLPKPAEQSDLKYKQYNEWVNQLLEIVEVELGIKKVQETARWYGGLMAYEFANGMVMYVHLKNVALKKVKQKKRWSQILYMSIILENARDKNFLQSMDEKAYLLLMDGDTQFTKDSVDLMRGMIQQDPERIGAVCGRIYPDCQNPGSNPIVWYQKFEYAAGHWFQKTAEHMFGTVLCCPGCFTLVRLAALYRRSGISTWDPIIEKQTPIEIYAVEVESARDVLKFDQGEDRMLSTILIQHGWTLQYCSNATALTYCPDNFRDFFIQRRRWISSTLANLYHLLGCSDDIVEANSASRPFMWYCSAAFASSLFSPATIILVIMGGVQYAILDYTIAIIAAIVIPAFYIFVCAYFAVDMSRDSRLMKEKKVNLQINTAYVLCVVYVVIMTIVGIGVARQIATNFGGIDSIYLLSLIGMFFATALLHGEFGTLTYGIIYLFLLPTMYLILTIYAIANTHDQSWGTRENTGGKAEKQERLFNLKELLFSFFKSLGFCNGPQKEDEESLIEKAPEPQPQPQAQAQPLIQPQQPQTSPSEEKKEVAAPKEEIQPERQKIRKLVSFRYRDYRGDEKIVTSLKAEEARFQQSVLKLSERLEERVKYKTSDKAKQDAEDRIRELAQLKNGSFLLLVLVTAGWTAAILTLSIHVDLQILGTNAFGLLFLIVMSLILLLQFFGMIFHRFGTFLTVIAMTPLSSSSLLTEKEAQEAKGVSSTFFPQKRVKDTVVFDRGISLKQVQRGSTLRNVKGTIRT